MTQNKPKAQMKYVFARLWNYLYQYKWLMVLALFLTVLSNLMALTGPVLSGYAVDAITPGKGSVQFQRVFICCGLMAIFYLLYSLISYLLSVLMIRLSQKIVYRMRQDVFNRLMTLPISFFDTHQTGDIISRISYDIDTVNATLSHDVLQIFASAITVFGSLLMMLMISPVLSLVFAVTIPISIFITRFMTGRVRPLFRARSAKLGELNGYTEEILSGQRTIKAYHQEENFIHRFDVKNEEAAGAYYQADYYGCMVGPCVNFINNLSLSLISVLGALLFLTGRLTLGSLSSFVLYSRKFSGPINEAANIISELQSAAAAAERIFRLIDEEPEPADTKDALILDGVKEAVRFEQVDFGYQSGRTILKNMDFTAQKGQMVAVVGPTGAGKTTIINLLMRFYDPSAGRIAIDQTEIRNFTRKSLRLAYGMVLQDTWLFHGTVFENIAYGKPDADMAEVIQAAKAAKIHHYIMQLPNGYQTILNEDGMNISQGQKQLLTIARAMLLNTEMLILDEATSNVDTQTEIQIQVAMRKLMENKTCFIIAHRLSTIRNADIILVIRDGCIAEQGNHEELLKKEGIYYQMYHSQFEGIT